MPIHSRPRFLISVGLLSRFKLSFSLSIWASKDSALGFGGRGDIDELMEEVEEVEEVEDRTTPSLPVYKAQLCATNIHVSPTLD